MCRHVSSFGLTFALALVLLAAPAEAVIFVSPSGDDAAPGTFTEPKRTIKTALEDLPEGVSLILFGGTYNAANQGIENLFDLTFPHPDQTLVAYPGDTPIIDWTGTGAAPGARFFDDSSSSGGGTLAGVTFRGWSRPMSFLRIDQASGVTIRDCTFDAIAPTDARPIIEVDDVSDLVIERCRFVNRPPTSLYYAIKLVGDGTATPERYAVRDCVFNDEAALADPDGRAAGVMAIAVDDLEVTGCRGVNAGSNRGPGSPLHFVELAGVRRALISDMHFQRYLRNADGEHPLHDADGIKLGSWAGQPSTDVRIQGCELWGTGHGIHVGNDSQHVEVSYVWCDSTYDDCVFCNDGSRDVTIRWVVSHYSQDDGIDIQGDDVDVRECTIVRTRNTAINVWETAANVSFRDVLVYDVRDPIAYPTSLSFLQVPWGWSFDHDAWYDPDGDQYAFHFGGAAHTFAEWQAAGHDMNGAFGVDPVFCNPDGRAWPIYSSDFTLSSSTPLATAGSDGGPIGALPMDCKAVAVPGAAHETAPAIRLRTRPNPARARVLVDVPAHSRVGVYDAAGRRVRTLDAGNDTRVSWDGRNDTGARVAAGVYFLRVAGSTATGRVVITP